MCRRWPRRACLWVAAWNPAIDASVWFVFVCCLTVSGHGIAGEPKAGAPDYTRDIKPILAKHCISCHGALWQKGDLRLDTAELAKKGGASGPAVHAQSPGDSPLLLAVEGRGGYERMPKEAPALLPGEIAALRRWIEAGAAAPLEKPQASPREHWAFRPIRRPAAPAGDFQNPIDAFVVAKQRELGLQAVPQADAGTVMRRLHFDLHGLPPDGPLASCCGERECSADSCRRDACTTMSRDACTSKVDEMLASPRYGERWGRHWMDVWRYSDWYGYQGEIRGSSKHIWHWRDWIVESLNADLPYDRMVLLMLAADEIESGNAKALRATGYLARSWHRYNRNVWLDDTIEHAGKAFLGLTLNCARCHDHKYDPVTQEEYYNFRAIFEPHDIRTDAVAGAVTIEANGLPRAYDKELTPATYFLDRGDEARPRKDRSLPPKLPAFFGKLPAAEPVALPRVAYQPALDAAFAETLRHAAIAKKDRAAQGLANAKSEAAKSNQRQALALAELELAALDARLQADRAKHAGRDAFELAQLAALAEAKLTAEQCRQRVAMVEAKMRDVPSLLAAAAKAVATGKAKRPASPGDLQKELAEAKAALDAANARVAKPGRDYQPVGPLYPPQSTGRRTALGRWIVAPDNPLAARVAVNHLWMRHFGSPLVDTTFDFGMNGRPPSNPELLDWLAAELIASGWKMKRMHQLMVCSQTYRLASTGRALPKAALEQNLRIDPDNRFYWRANPRRLEAEAVRDAILAISDRLDGTLGGPDIDHRQDDVSQRRSLYLRHAKEKQSTFLTTFDAANSVECYRRAVTVAPQQALALANGKLVDDASRRVAARIEREIDRHGMDSDGTFVLAAFERMLARRPTDSEFDICLSYLTRRRRAEGSSARVSLARVLFNHTDFVTVH